MIDVLRSGFGRGVWARLERAFFGPGTMFLILLALMLALIWPDTARAFAAEFLQLDPTSRWGFFLVLLLSLLALSWLLELWTDTLYAWMMGLRLPGWLYIAGVRRWQKNVERLREKRKHLRRLLREGGERGTVLTARRLVEVELKLRHIPPQEALLPTAFGNVIHAANEHVRLRYGLDPVVLWPHLRSRLPRDERREIERVKELLDNAVEAAFLGVLLTLVAITFFALEGLRAWPLLFLSLGFTWLACRLAMERAKVFSDLIRASYDLNRRLIYEAVGFESPPLLDGTPIREEQECRYGRDLTRFIWYGPRNSCH